MKSGSEFQRDLPSGVLSESAMLKCSGVSKRTLANKRLGFNCLKRGRKYQYPAVLIYGQDWYYMDGFVVYRKECINKIGGN